jgi:tripeptidyl-peptidase-1
VCCHAQIFERYSVPLGTKGSGSRYGNSQCVVAFEEQYIDVAGDLRPFAQQLGFPLFQTPTIDGQNDPTNPGMESTLDISYIMGVGQNVPTTFMSLTGQGPAKPPGDGAYILEWAMHISNLTSPPLVTSVSYGDTEDGYYTKFGSYVYIDRMEVELAKMAARGLTVLAGSGDAGVSNVGEEGNDISDTDPTCAPFRPFYPSNSPYVTSVSSTFLSTNYLPVCQTNLPVGNSQSLPIVCHQVGEIAVGVSQGMAWTTGGGFSNRSASNPRAPWQKDVVEAYLATSNLPQPSSLYNAKGRGYPDVATLGHNLLMMYNGGLVTVDGTSASGPVMAGLVSLLNDVRLKARKAPLGLLNPFLYAAARDQPAAFMDVTVGTNADGDVQPKCSPYPSTCPAGFETGPGWNAVTGLGTPNWTVLRDHALAIVADNYVRTKSD